MKLLERAIRSELPDLMARNTRFRVVGRPNGVPVAVRQGLEHVVRETQHNTGLHILLAFNYGGAAQPPAAPPLPAPPAPAGAAPPGAGSPRATPPPLSPPANP